MCARYGVSYVTLRCIYIYIYVNKIMYIHYIILYIYIYTKICLLLLPGGHVFLRTGQAAIVPPGCMVFLAGKGLLPEGFAPSDLDDATRSPGCQFLVPFSLLKEFEFDLFFLGGEF